MVRIWSNLRSRRRILVLRCQRQRAGKRCCSLYVPVFGPLVMRVSVGKVVTERQWYNSRWAVCVEHLGKSTGVVEKTGGVSSTSPCISPMQEWCSSLLGAKIHSVAAHLKCTLSTDHWARLTLSCHISPWAPKTHFRMNRVQEGLYSRH